MLRGLHRLLVQRLSAAQQEYRWLSVRGAVTESTTKVNPNAYTPRLLEDNLDDLELLLADEAVRKDEKLWNTNQESFNNLKLFLKQYTACLMKEETEFLPRQRHALEFIIRDDAHETGLRRIVCHVGTTGGDSHRLVTRALQGLFKEVGLTPNFLWDQSYEVREEHLTREQRAAKEDARVDAIAAQIMAHQQGKTGAAEEGPLKVADPNKPFPLSAADGDAMSASGAGSSQRTEEQVDDAFDDEIDDEELEGEEIDIRRVRELETICAHLAMKPWVEVESASRKETEEQTAEDMFFHTLAAGCSLREPVECVWKGERDVESLIARYSDTSGTGPFVPEEMLRQVVDCTVALEQAFGPPDATSPRPIKELMDVVRPIRHLTVALQTADAADYADAVDVADEVEASGAENQS